VRPPAGARPRPQDRRGHAARADRRAPRERRRRGLRRRRAGRARGAAALAQRVESSGETVFFYLRDASRCSTRSAPTTACAPCTARPTSRTCSSSSTGRQIRDDAEHAPRATRSRRPRITSRLLPVCCATGWSGASSRCPACRQHRRAADHRWSPSATASARWSAASTDLPYMPVLASGSICMSDDDAATFEALYSPSRACTCRRPGRAS
jgi:hypothetical protein